MNVDNSNSMTVCHNNLKDLLDFEEGFREKIYLDTNGVITGGRGHAFQVGSKLPIVIWESIFDYDISEARRKFNLLNLKHLSKRRQWVCIAMIYQLGFDGFCTFENTIQFLRQKNYHEASIEMLDSKWAKLDTPGRALRMSRIMSEG